jgi:hypothetical protein
MKSSKEMRVDKSKKKIKKKNDLNPLRIKSMKQIFFALSLALPLSAFAPTPFIISGKTAKSRQASAPEQLDPAVRVSLQDDGEDGVQLDFVVGSPEQEPKISPEELERSGRPFIKTSYNNAAWAEKCLCTFRQNYEGDAQSRREFYRALFRQIKPENLETEGEFYAHQAPWSWQEAGEREDKSQAEQVAASQQEHTIPESAGFRFQMRQVDGVPGVAIKRENGAQVFVSFSDGGERGIAHVVGRKHFPVAPGQDIMHRMDMEPFYGAFSVTGERAPYAPRNGTPAEMTKYLLSTQIISKQQ